MKAYRDNQVVLSSVIDWVMRTSVARIGTKLWLSEVQHTMDQLRPGWLGRLFDPSDRWEAEANLQHHKPVRDRCADNNSNHRDLSAAIEDAVRIESKRLCRKRHAPKDPPRPRKVQKE